MKTEQKEARFWFMTNAEMRNLNFSFQFIEIVGEFELKCVDFRRLMNGGDNQKGF